MESLVAIEAGASHFLRESLHFLSDKYRTYFCVQCGLPALGNVKKGIYVCKVCKKQETVTKSMLPYGWKTISQELMGMQIAPRLLF